MAMARHEWAKIGAVVTNGWRESQACFLPLDLKSRLPRWVNCYRSIQRSGRSMSVVTPITTFQGMSAKARHVSQRHSALLSERIYLANGIDGSLTAPPARSRHTITGAPETIRTPELCRRSFHAPSNQQFQGRCRPPAFRLLRRTGARSSAG